ncbi:UspA domain protein [Pseudarthrobacter chlorophenolicus A6]|uniref:UspA domain protein n=1 Tax=Pseudarthrobacter chlorophenolicus (strain ATCC 700700 / DSM 12829 / CIP 107037 / JCM 12360 / KCTC 9906 / NCIMB 13794 / A6) TaxID=452863 RepID=B8H820_PSECP|nr:universal stress protein [Pseudarthrobacter chlorophenolicus]ACL41823.1 UspA domain protein [Pseudarthrobacter chlorophenolicus A6]SDQ57897.1 Nucleotide-binding universal stress protein, UspA family [Pseudarthrobacter chlorophenolicus]
MTSERFSGTAPLLVGIMPKQHPEVLHTAAGLAARLGQPLLCAYVDEASYLVEWDPARSAHRLSLHPDADDEDIRALTSGLKADIMAAVGKLPAGTGTVDWTLRTLAGDPARALARLAAETNAPMIVVGTSERGFSHRLSEALNGSVGAWLSHHQSLPVLVVPYRMPAHQDR